MAGETLRRRLQASEAERRRWARELHDATLQELGGLRSCCPQPGAASDPERLAAAVDEAVEQLAGATADLRALITDLRPAALDELGIEAALDGARRSRRQPRRASTSGWRSSWSSAGRHSAELESTVYRLVQEALTNVVKHAQAQPAPRSRCSSATAGSR